MAASSKNAKLPAESRTQFTVNRRGDPVQIGTTGKYYCGKYRLDCGCCNGICGPTIGCNCADCMQLDVSFRHLPPGHLVNSDGRVSRRSPEGHYFCGTIIRTFVVSKDDVTYTRYPPMKLKCSPMGPNSKQCTECKTLDGVRYNSVHSEVEHTNATARTRKDTETNSEPKRFSVQIKQLNGVHHRPSLPITDTLVPVQSRLPPLVNFKGPLEGALVNAGSHEERGAKGAQQSPVRAAPASLTQRASLSDRESAPTIGRLLQRRPSRGGAQGIHTSK